jgi:hypothetical protein
VVIFHDARDIPSELRDILANFGYFKVQSGIRVDVELLALFGIAVKGLVDSRVVMGLVPPAPGFRGKTGSAAQMAAIWPNERGVSWHSDFLDAYEKQDLSGRVLRHSLQDVMVPIAISVLAAKCEAERRDLSLRDNLFPILNELWEMCAGKDPDILFGPSGSFGKCPRVESRWRLSHHPKSAVCELNSHSEVQDIRMARGNFVEPIQDGRSDLERLGLAENATAALRKLPTSKDLRAIDLCLALSLLCQKCGSSEHGPEFESCPSKLGGSQYLCDYQHAGVSIKPHSVRVCRRCTPFAAPVTSGDTFLKST